MTLVAHRSGEVLLSDACLYRSGWSHGFRLLRSDGASSAAIGDRRQSESTRRYGARFCSRASLVGWNRWVELSSSTTSGHDIGPAGLDFLRVIAALELRLDLEASSIEQLDHCRRLEEAKVKVNALAPELVDVSDLITDVESNEQASTSNQHPS